jgi:hypothetical protein
MAQTQIDDLLNKLGLVKKQFLGCTDQRELVINRLEEVARLEAEAPRVSENNAWSKMPALKIGRSLKTARFLLEEADSILTAEIDFYSEAQSKIDTIMSGADDDTKIAALSAILAEAQPREPETAGLAAYCMASITATQIFAVQAMEKARSYRSKKVG